MIINHYEKTKCINGCELFNDKSKYLYWEDRNVSTDEVEIINFLNKNELCDNKIILHIGIGNSYFASNIKKYKKVDGISISTNEINYAKSLQIENYRVIFFNKFSNNGFYKNHLNHYDFIIDTNIKSFTCCQIAFENLFLNYSLTLKKNGKIFTSKNGMNWNRVVRPVLSFSLKKLFHKRLKEFDGPANNKLKVHECIELSKKHDLEFIEPNNSQIAFFKK